MRFERTDELRGVEIVHADLSGARLDNVNLSGARIRESLLVDARISGLITGLVVNDIEVGPLIAAEMERRYPERAKLTPVTADGARIAWAVIEDIWVTLRKRMEVLPEATLHERVDGEWSALETVRHLIFVTDGWISNTVLGEPAPYHPFDMPPSFITDPETLGIDVGADPLYRDVIAVRAERMKVVGDLVGSLTDSDLDRRCGEHTLLQCLHVVFDEEWYHHWFANRDLDRLAGTA